MESQTAKADEVKGKKQAYSRRRRFRMGSHGVREDKEAHICTEHVSRGNVIVPGSPNEFQ